MARAVRIDDLFRLILPHAPTISPSGEQIAFAIKRVDGAENRYYSHLNVVSAKGGRVRALTHGAVTDTSPAWSPDGGQLAFVSDRGGKLNVWILPLAGGEPRRITDLAGGPISSLKWSPDGKEIAFSHISMPVEDPEVRKKQATYKHITTLFHKEDGLGWHRGEYWTVWKTAVKSGRMTPLTIGPHHDGSPAWSPDSKRIAYVSSADDRAPDLVDVRIMDRRGKGARTITTKTGSRSEPRFSLDGKHLYWVGWDGGSGEWLNHEHAVHRAPVSGSAASTVINPGHDRWAINMVGSDTCSSFATMLEPYHDGTEERVLFGSDEDGSYRLYSVPATGGSKPRLEVDGKVSVLGVSVTASGQFAACIGTNNDNGEIYSGRLDGSCEPKQITKVTAPFFRPLKYNLPEEVRFQSGDTEIQGWILTPPNFRKGKKYPCLIEIHGGPMTQYGETWFHEMQVLAAKGWVVAYCNPRGSSGRGKKFANCIEGEWGKKDWDDMQAFTNYLARKPFVDSKRIGILGGSYGGYMTSWAIGHTTRYRAAVSMRNAADFWIHWGSSDFGWFRTKFFRGKRPWENPKAYHAVSPAFYADKIKTPLLIIHSEGDLRCPIAESEMLFTSMKVLDQAPCEMVRFEGEFHGLPRGGKPRNREERLKRIVDWFERYL